MASEASSGPLDRATLQQIDAIAAERNDSWIAFRRARHASPEPSGDERQTSKAILREMQRLQLSAAIPGRETGVVADLMAGSGTDQTPQIAVRADIDALRMHDRKETEYASAIDGCAHACGHDVHTTIVLGVAESLSLLRERGHACLETPIRFLFQAAEETCDGATWMVEDGYLNGIDSVLGIHVEPNLPVGQVGIRYGVLTAQVDEVFMTVRGQGGHTARPHMTSDPLHAAALLVTTLYQHLPRSIDVRKPSVFTAGRIVGGVASNVIPDIVEVAGTLRTTDTQSRETLMQRMTEICRHVGGLTGNEIEIDFQHPLGSVVNAMAETNAFESASADVVGEDSVVIIEQPSMGGEDFAMYLDGRTGSQIRLGCATTLPWPHLHSPVFDVDERVIAIGVRILSRAVLSLAAALVD